MSNGFTVTIQVLTDIAIAIVGGVKSRSVFITHGEQTAYTPGTLERTRQIQSPEVGVLERIILIFGQQVPTVIDKLRGPLRGGLAYPSALVVVGVGGEGDAPELDLDQAVVGVPMVGAQAVGDQVAVGIILVITSAHGKVLVELVALIIRGPLVVSGGDAVAQLVVLIKPVVLVAGIVIGSDDLAEGIVSPIGPTGGIGKSRARGGEGSALAEIVHKIRKTGNTLLGKSEVVFLQKKIPGGVIGVLHLVGWAADLLDQMGGLVEVGILEAVGSGAEGGEAAE